jgi:hypothetical protein|tara:strand:- start:1098 stop:1259 length:162 start_codon:yes stop_codon:yes gene_type:complete
VLSTDGSNPPSGGGRFSLELVRIGLETVIKVPPVKGPVAFSEVNFPVGTWLVK